LKLTMVYKDHVTDLLFNEVIKEIKPGDAPFSFEHNLGNISQGMYLMASLVTPTGIEVYSSKIYLSKPEQPAIKEIIPGNNVVRVVFDKSAATDTYKVYYGKDGPGFSTEETINNFIDIKELVSNHEYNFALVAINGKGESEKSELFTAKTNDLLLPPIIWEIVPVGNSFVIGYSVDAADQTFEIKYGTEPGVYENHLKDITLKGSYKVSSLEMNKTYFLRMKRNTEQGTSSWSDEQTIEL
jgi:beta-galactosidase